MLRFLRAAAFAAASFVALFGAVYAGPSRAWEIEPSIIASDPLAHGAIALDVGDLSLNRLEPEIAKRTGAPPPIVSHVEAPVPEAAESETPPKRSLAELVALHSASTTSGREHECLAGAVYFEAKGEPLAGQLSVAEVVLNRARSGRFPSSVCGVVKQRGQFSFIRGGVFPPIARRSAAWSKAVAVARIAMEEMAEGDAPRALFFHARYVKPGWRGLTRVAAVGNHIFYR
jgi:hypothetical protein